MRGILSRKDKNCKGFTLVELIVVLVILAILIALLVPALTGYIDRSKKKAAMVECRHVVQAAQTILTEEYESMTFTIGLDPSGTTAAGTMSEMKSLGEVDGTVDAARRIGGTIVFVQYTTKDGKYTVIYDKNYKTNGRSALYTIEEAGKSSDGDKSLESLFSSWKSVNDDSGRNDYVRYVKFTISGSDYYIIDNNNGDNSAAKDAVEKALGSSYNPKRIYMVDEDREVSNSTFKDLLSEYCGKTVVSIIIDTSGKATITYK